jgi:uncharacterized SAM-binding protein YcdF (DUF218 family)
VFLGREIWLAALGRALVRSDEPGKVDAILVLAGGPSGRRVLKACELLRAGSAPVALVSGSLVYYGQNEADLAIEYAAANGCPAERLEPLKMRALSTRDEADGYAGEIERRKLRSVAVVTDDFHTARAARVFERRFNGSLDVRAVPATGKYFSPDGWWKNREGRKLFLLEASKTLADWLGM